MDNIDLDAALTSAENLIANLDRYDRRLAPWYDGGIKADFSTRSGVFRMKHSKPLPDISEVDCQFQMYAVGHLPAILHDIRGIVSDLVEEVKRERSKEPQQ